MSVCVRQFNTRSRRDQRNWERMTAEFLSQYYRDDILTTLNVTVYASDGMIKCHTEIFDLLDHDSVFPGVVDENGNWSEPQGGYTIPCPFATVQDVDDVLRFCYLDVIILQEGQLTRGKISSLRQVAAKLNQKYLWEKLWDINKSLPTDVPPQSIGYDRLTATVDDSLSKLIEDIFID